MGLDMYVLTAPAELVRWAQISFPMLWVKDAEGYYNRVATVNSDFAYWRKFNALHGWMEDLYKAKGGLKEFNCEYVRLMPDDLYKLAQDAKVGIEGRAGFFWGSVGEWSSYDAENVLEFVDEANEAIDNGLAVIYHAWY